MSKKCNKCGEVKTSDYFNKNKSIKCGLTSACKACRKEDYRDNQESERASARAYYAKNREAMMLKHRAYRQANPDKCSATTAKRRSAKLERTVPWADLVSIQAIYSEAKRLTETTGVKHHVDHVIPLQGELVSGLHVESNLQVLTAQENCSKSNKFNTNN
jgi:hypothetical protein